jgi:hypothetical protein
MTMPAGYVDPEDNLFQYLDKNGDESGDIEAIGNYSSTADDFFIQPPNGKVYQIHRLIVSIQSSSVIAALKYGSLAALANGIKIYTTKGPDAVEKLINKAPIKTHDDWGGICHDSIALNYGSVAGKSVSVRWSFFKSGTSIWLNGDLNHKLILRLNDNFTGLSAHRFYAQGIIHNS